MFGPHPQRASALFIFIVFFEIFLGRSLEIFSVRPDLFLILIVFWAFCIDRQSTVQIALILGLLRDIFSTGFFGIETISYFLIGCLAALVSLKVSKSSPWMRAVALFIFSLLNLCFFFLLENLFLEEAVASAHFWSSGILYALYTTLLGFWLMGFLERRVYAKAAHLASMV